MVLVGLSFYIGETNMEIKQKIDILGTEYAVGIDDAACIAMNADGLCKYYDKEIILRKLEKLLDPDSSEESKLIRMKEVARHEIIHAFFAEAGLFDYSDNEQLVNWIAIQFPKMLKVFHDADCI